MKLTKKIEAEIQAFLDCYWDSYFKGDFEKWATFLPDSYKNIGTTQEEIWHSKQDILNYTHAVKDQMIGMAEMRNKKFEFISYDPYIMVHELGDVYIKTSEGWSYYAPLRLSSLIQKIEGKWQVLHQHGSYPDSKTQEGEAFGFDALKAENLRLQDAVKKRTAELERKNRELEIEASLERVRAIAMGMKKPEELLKICEVVYNELKDLGFDEIRNAIIHTFHDEQQYFDDYDYSDLRGGAISRIPYQGSAVIDKFLADIRKGEEAFSEIKVAGKQLADWKQFRKANNEADDPKLDKIKALYYYIYSVGGGSIGISTFNSIGDDKLDILKRFRNVFDLAYKRYVDISQAEAQAREAQIEAALERVRSRAMGMHQTSELQYVIQTVHKELLGLDLAIYGGSFIVINEDVGPNLRCWGAGGTADTSVELIVPHFNMPFCTNLVAGIQSGPGFFTETFSQQEKKKFFSKLFQQEPWSGLDPKQRNETLNSPGGYTRSVAVSKYTSILIVNQNGKKFSDADNDILKRFAKVFEQAYVRFLDIKKAEAQAREAQIEAALERIRATTMAMHRSDELLHTSQMLFDQFRQLGQHADQLTIGIMNEPEGIVEINATLHGQPLPKVFRHPITEPYVMNKVFHAWKGGQQHMTLELTAKELEAYNQFRNQLVGTDMFATHLPKDEKRIIYASFFSKGMFAFGDKEQPTAETRNILDRFAKVFEQTYTRFLDLQKAEAQAREAQVETALERVRSRTMAMQKSSELNEVAFVLFEQIRILGGKLWGTGFSLCNVKQGADEFWFANEMGVMPPVFIPHTDDDVHIAMHAAFESGKTYHVEERGGELLKDHYKYLITLPGIKEFFQPMFDAGISFPEWQQWHAAYFSKGYLLIITLEPYTDPDVFIRFAKVFDQTYTRFLDLQKAEAQAREAQIEAALEKVRSRSLAMHHTNELGEVITVVFDKLKELNFPVDDGVALITFKDGTKDLDEWMMIPGAADLKFHLPYFDHPVLSNLWNAKESGQEFLTWTYTKEENESFCRHIFTHSDFKKIPEEVKQLSLGASHYSNSLAFQKNTAIFMNHYTGRVLQEGEIEILKRFARVFEQAYVRFLDLQKAEAQAREAEIELALERVRARAMAMQHSEELKKLIATVYTELTKLNLALDRCVIWIMNDEDLSTKLWMSGSEGIPVSFNVPYHEHPPYLAFLDAWKKRFPKWHYELGGQVKKDWDDYVFTHTDMKFFPDPVKNKMQSTREVVMTASFYSFGCLQAAGSMPLTEEQHEVLNRFARVFDSTYTRFNDLKKAEAQARQAEKDLIEIKKARKKAEAALTELQATQAQLIQSEKMASLGELTAGIAHEIQNPLNFVNNFSEVSNELIEELRIKSEALKVDDEEVYDILNDIKQNLEKINFHGKRADSIVKGMLQHSRSSTGKKEPTDINTLADEYLRLAYHGLRAKDKNFNAQLNTNFDPHLQKINIVPQDIGRVMLNLVNNAFYACAERSRSACSERSRDTADADKPAGTNANGKYEPAVTVSTRKKQHMVEVTVADNGMGIPQKVLDKIFQPFFTTKPTGQGTGLGLSLAYDIIKSHGGELNVKTSEGEGSTFIISLPENNTG